MAVITQMPPKGIISENVGYLDFYIITKGGKKIICARAWPDYGRIKSKKWKKTHTASSILLNAYRAYSINLKQPMINLWKPVQETTLDYFRHFNQSFCYHHNTLPHIKYIDVKSIDVDQEKITFTIIVSSPDPWILKTRNLYSNFLPRYYTTIRDRQGAWKRFKITRVIPENTINPIDSGSFYHTFVVPFNSLNIPVCNIPFSPAKHPPSSFPLPAFLLENLFNS